MNEDLLSLQCRKTRVFMSNRPRQVTFSQSHHLYRSTALQDDLKLLERERYNPAGPLESRVWGEHFDQDALDAYVTLREDNFWSMVFSDRWSQYSSIRITEGSLLTSLLLALYTLVGDGKLLTFSTETYQKNVAIESDRGKPKVPSISTEVMKTVYTYYSMSAAELTKILESQQGMMVDEGEIMRQNPQFIASIISDLRQSSFNSTATGSFPPWTKRTQYSYDVSKESESYPPPLNPPNSPLPASNSQVHGENMHLQTCHRKEQNTVTKQEPLIPNYNSLPLVKRTRYNGLALKPSHGIAVVGQRLDSKKEQVIGNSTLYPNDRESLFKLCDSKNRTAVHNENAPRYVSSRGLHVTNASELHLRVHKNQAVLQKDRRCSLQEKLVEKNHLRDVDICPRALAPRTIEFINVISPLSPTTEQKQRAAQSKFNIGRLRINYSLEKIRPELVRHPVFKEAPQTPKFMESAYKDGQLGVGSLQSRVTEVKGDGKEYLMRRYLRESNIINPFGVHSSQSNIESEESRQPSSKIEVSSKEFYKHRVPNDFIDNCMQAAHCFIIRKEQVTSSRLYKTVTTFTINRIPDGGFQRWKYSV